MEHGPEERVRDVFAQMNFHSEVGDARVVEMPALENPEDKGEDESGPDVAVCPDGGPRGILAVVGADDGERDARVRHGVAFAFRPLAAHDDVHAEERRHQKQDKDRPDYCGSSPVLERDVAFDVEREPLQRPGIRGANDCAWGTIARREGEPVRLVDHLAAAEARFKRIDGEELWVCECDLAPSAEAELDDEVA